MERACSRGSKHFTNMSLRGKLILPTIATMAVSLIINLALFSRINTTTENMDQVYATNIRLGELERLLTELEGNVYQYLNVQSQDALDHYRQERHSFEQMISEIDDTVTDHPARRMERNIKNLALSWLSLSDAAIEAKERHDVNSYKDSFPEMQKIYSYLLDYIKGLDNLRFKANSENYSLLYRYLRYLEIFVIVVLIGVTACLMMLLYGIIGSFTRPLEHLAAQAEEVGRGNFDISFEEGKSRDEVATVAAAFNKMVASINDYILQVRESAELEIRMKEKELVMENLLKDAQLKYYQAQINPHFLFNTLNAGQQLAMMEGAEKTYSFMENVAAFFRYRLKKNGEDSTLREEIELIDSYMYIMNVRFSGEIHLEKEVDTELLGIRFPGMVLQPIIENALNHGLRGVEWEKHIWFSVKREEEKARIVVRDNGVGIPEETVRELNSGEFRHTETENDGGGGVGLSNVRERLKLYFDREDVMTVVSSGEGKGTQVIILVPILFHEQGVLAGTSRATGK